MPIAAHRDDYGGDCMTNPNGARWEHHEAPPLSTGLTRRSDGRWTPAQRARNAIGPVAVPDPKTTELAVTKVRGAQTDAGWDAVTEFDPVFEEASTRFFETDPGNGVTFDRLMDGEPGHEGVEPGDEPIPGLDPRSWAHVEGEYHDPNPGGRGSRELPGELDYYGADRRRRERPIEQGYPAGSGYEAVYGDAAVDPVESEVDDDELVTGAAARRNAIEWAVVLVAAVLLALVLRALVLQAFYIPSPSMEDTLLIQDRVLVNKLSYRFGDVGRGDIVVFHRTDEEITSAGPNQPKDVIKRVIALGGETIEIRESTVFINDQELVEPYLDPGLVMPDFGPLTVPEGFLFVMGDNRSLSSDSRGELGPIAEERVVGRAFVLFWPVDRVSRL